MPKFNIGDNVVDVLNLERRGIIVDLYPPRRGTQLFKVRFIGEENDCDLPETRIKAEFNVSDPFERIQKDIYGNFIEFSRINTSFKIQYSNNSTISSLKASKTLFKAYQFKPLLKFLNSDNRRLLIADEVGLGKTIEAGHIMLELQARKELKNALIVCPKSLQVKWQTELMGKFGLSFDIIGNAGDLLQLFRLHDGSAKAIITYERLRSLLSSDDENKSPELILQNHFSLVLCDEAHRLRNSGTQLYKSAKKLMQSADGIVFLTATPVMISQENLYNLMHLLNGELYDNKTNFLNALSVNRSFVRAQSELRAQIPLDSIASYLQEDKISTSYKIGDDVISRDTVLKDWYADMPIYQRIIKRLTTEPDSKKLRAELHADLEEMSPMSASFSRTRKREVTTDFSQPERNPVLVTVDLSPEERCEYDKVVNSYKNDLALITVKQRVASSVWAYKNDVQNAESLDADIDLFRNEKDSKIDRLHEIIQKVFSNGERKIIVFAIFKATVKYLKLRLEALGYKCVMIHGENVSEREELLRQFKEDDSINLLLSTEVSSEGLDMQFCNSLVNYDLPWNPMVVEQRIGRIDRFGQKSPVVNIYNFVIKNSIQEDIYKRLLDRIGIFRNSIGDIEAILDSEIEYNGQKISLEDIVKRQERELCLKELTPEQQRRKIDDIAQAIENEIKNLEDLQEGLEGSMTNDSYFREQVDKMLKNNTYVTEAELKNFIQLMMKEALPSCTLQMIGNEIYELEQPQSRPRSVSSFLTENQPVGQEYNTLFQLFRNSIVDKRKFCLTFNQEVAYNNQSVYFINIYHPLVIASLTFFEKKKTDDANQRTFKFEMPVDSLSKPMPKQQFFLAVYRIDESREVFGQKKMVSNLCPILYDTVKNEVVADSEMSEEFLGKVVARGQNLRSPLELNYDSSFYNEMRGDFADAICCIIEEHRKEAEMKIENERKKQEKYKKQNYDVRSERLWNQFEEAQKEYISSNNENKDKTKLRLLLGQINKLDDDFDMAKKQLNADPKLNIKESLLSLSLINLI